MTGLARVVLLLGLAFATALPTAAQQQGDLFGAIAYSEATRKIGVASDNVSQAEAEGVALQNCRVEAGAATDCKVIMWVRNACAVLAIGQDGGWGTDWGADRATAERKALTVCGKYSQSCQVVRRVCALKGN